MLKFVLPLLIAGLLAFPVAHAQLPDREAFGKQKRSLEQIPLSAFQLDSELGRDLKMEVWAESPLLFSPVAMDVGPQGRNLVDGGHRLQPAEASGQHRAADHQLRDPRPRLRPRLRPQRGT